MRAVPSQIASDRAPTKKKEERLHIYYSGFFLLFLHESRILIFIKNNIKNIKYILTVRSNSV